MARTIQKVTANFDGTVRHDTMEGRPYLVAPMVMLTEGVHKGSGGALFYPQEELGKSPQVWNHKPVVVYHPIVNGVPVSACDPVVLSNRKVGVIMNTRFEDGKLKAEAWMEESRIKTVDNRIAEAIQNQKVMELSTGLFSDNESMVGDFNGEHYEAIARNYQPDHLALLPDLKGACSVEDGAGLLRNTLVLNEMGFSTIRGLLSSVIPDDAWIEEVYESSVIYELEGQLWKQSYEDDEGSVELTGQAKKVIKVIEYRAEDGTFVGNINKGENQMAKTKKELVDNLIVDKSVLWNEKDRGTLEAMDKKILAKMTPVVNEEGEGNAVQEAAENGGDGVSESETPVKETTAAKETPAETPTETSAESESPAQNKQKTTKEVIANSPPEIAAVLSEGMDSLNREKSLLVNHIVKNPRCKFTKEVLTAKPIKELRLLATLASDEETGEIPPIQNTYGGQQPINENTAEIIPLEAPTLNKHFEKASA